MGFIRRLLQVLLLVATLVVGAAAAVIIVTQTAWFRDWLRMFIVRQANQYLNGRLSIGRLGGNLFFGLEFEDLGVSRGGERVIAVRNAGIDYSVIQFISGNVVIDHIRLDRPRILLKREAGAWNLGQLVKRQRQEKQRTGPAGAVTIGEVGISDGRLEVDGASQTGADGATGTSGSRPSAAGGTVEGGLTIPHVIDHIDARFSFAYEPVHYTVDIGHLSLRGHQPAFDLNDLSGRISERDASLFIENLAVRTAGTSLKVDGSVSRYASTPVLDLKATSDKLDIPEIARLVPALRGILLQPAFRVSAKGPLDAVGFDFGVRSSAGDASGRLTADLTGREHGIKGEVHLRDLDLAPIVKSPAAKSDLTGLARVDVRFPAAPGAGPVSGTFSVSTFSARLAGYQADKIEARGRVDGKRVTVQDARAVAYGAAATAAGTVEPGVRGPSGAPGLAMDLHGAVAGLDLRRLPRQLKVPLIDSRLNLDYHVAGVGGQLSGDARLRPSSLAGATIADQTTASFSTSGEQLTYSATGEIGSLDIERLAEGLKIAALSTARFQSDINGRFSVRGSGTALPTLRLDANASLFNSTLDGMSLPLMGVDAQLADGGGRFRADGGFSNLDPARLTGNASLRGSVGGRLNLDATLSRLSNITPDDVTGSVQLGLDRSRVAGLEVERGNVSAQYASSMAQVKDLTVAGPDINVKASGTVALGNTGSSNFAYHFDTPDLGTVAKLASLPLRGFVTTDGRLTGNRTALRAQGDLKGGNLAYGEAQALTAQSHYDVSLPDLDAARAQVRADSTLGFLQVAGQNINVVRATTTYGNRNLAFDVQAEQSVRNGHVVGNLVLHPDHQEVHLTRFGLAMQGSTWALAPDSTPTVNYAGGDITVENTHLVSGQQSLVAQGTIGKQASNLRAALNNVDLAHVDTWLIGDRRLGGMLNAGVTVTGPSSALRVAGDFAIDHGAFREFRYDTLGGNVDYSQDRLALDIRLQQSPQAWLFARGTLPVALFRSPTTESGAPAPGSNAPVDLTIRSSPIDLGLVQGFTGAVTKASGTLLADVRVAGTAATPQMSGRVDVTNGAFTVTPVGVSYRDLNGRIDLQPNRAVIDHLTVTDEHGRTMSASGDVGLQGRSLGAVRLKVNSRKFEVIHNDLGRLTLNTNVGIAGDLRAPQVTGEIDVNTGQINLDQVLDRFTSSAYSVKPTEPLSGSPQGPIPPAGAGAQPTGTAGRGQTLPAGTPATQLPPHPQGTPPPVTERAGVSGVGQPAAGPRAGAPAASASPFDAATIDVHIKVPDDLVVRGKDIQPGNTPIGLGNVNLTLGGDIRLDKRPMRQLRLVGMVKTIRGTYDFQGRRFDIQRDGTVRFDGFMPPDPALDVTATRLISGVEARVHVGGTARKPELTLTSNPPLEQADILSLIIFNQPANALGSGDQVSLAQRASALATGFVAGKLADSIGNALNLDVFEIQTETMPGGGTGATVTLGQQVGRNLYFKVIQGVGADNSSQFVLDYSITNYLRFETTMSQGGTATRTLMRRVEQSGADLIFFFSY